jgi:hypothetical protein
LFRLLSLKLSGVANRHAQKQVQTGHRQRAAGETRAAERSPPAQTKLNEEMPGLLMAVETRVILAIGAFREFLACRLLPFFAPR